MIVSNNDDESIRILCKTILRVTKTVLYNMHNEDKKYQSTIKSNLIKPSDVDKLHVAVFNHLKNTTMKELKELIESYESKNGGSYPEYTVSVNENF